MSTVYKSGLIPINREKHNYWLKKAVELGFPRAISDWQEPEHSFYLVDTEQVRKDYKRLQKGKDVDKILQFYDNRKCPNRMCTSVEIDTRFKVCQKCEYVKYCSRACQVEHWKAGHKKECPDLKRERAEDREFLRREGSCYRALTALENEEGIESLLYTDGDNKCSNPSCTSVETDKNFQLCGKCRHVKYCSRECQSAHWKAVHKKECPKLKAKKDSSVTLHRNIMEELIETTPPNARTQSAAL